MSEVFLDAGHIFHHYLECSITEEEWKNMTVEEALAITQDVEDLLAGRMTPLAFSTKYRLPRR